MVNADGKMVGGEVQECVKSRIYYEDMYPTTFWIKFFQDAGIPATEAANHAVTFVQNRINQDMLLELTKEYLNDMGISMMGDVIAILRHAKQTVTQSSKSKLLKGVMINPITGNPMRSTAASRTVAHYLRSADGADSPKPISLDLATRLGNRDSPKRGPSPNLVRLGAYVRDTKDDVPVPTARRVLPEHEGKYKISMPKGTTARSRRILKQNEKVESSRGIMASADSPSVFSRLGASTSDSPSPSPDPTSVFNRLGGAVKRPATSTVPGSEDESDVEGDALEYQGIFKVSPSPAKRRAVDIETEAKKITRTVNVVRAPKKQKEPSPETESEESSSSEAESDEPMPSTEGIFSPFSQSTAKKPVSLRLGTPVVAEAQSSTSAVSVKDVKGGKKTAIKVSKPAAKKGVQSRLGPLSVDSEPATKKASGVFSRLGKQHSQESLS